MIVTIWWCFFMVVYSDRRVLSSSLFRRRVQKYLANHVIEAQQARSERECALYCVRDMSCASVNYRHRECKASGMGKGLCEQNNKTFLLTSEPDWRINPQFNHLDIIKEVKE